MERTRRGFTIVELLVVIGVIAVLTALLLPTLRKARAQAKAVVCMSNLRQLGLAMNFYANDNKGIICAGADYDDNQDFNINTHPWYYMLAGQNVTRKVYAAGLKDWSKRGTTIYRCPESDSPEDHKPLSAWMNGVYGFISINTLTKASQGKVMGYEWSQVFPKPTSGTVTKTFDVLRVTKIKQQTTFPILFDTSGMDDHRFRIAGPSWSAEGIIRPGGGAWANQAMGIWLVHMGRANGLFADWHVEPCTGVQLQKTSVPQRNVTGFRGISAWKNEMGREVITDW